MKHNHADRGTFHVGCKACWFRLMVYGEDSFDKPFTAVGPGGTVVAPRVKERAEGSVPDLEELGRIGQDTLGGNDTVVSTSINRAGQIVIGADLTGSTLRITDDDVERRGAIQGQEMGNKPTLQAERELRGVDLSQVSEIEYVQELLGMASAPGHAGSVALLAHLYDDHERSRFSGKQPLFMVQALHGLLHQTGIGHQDSAEHLVKPFAPEQWRSRRQLLRQTEQSQQMKHRRQQAHAQRQQAAQESRRQVMVDSARALQRATRHAEVTIGHRVKFNRAGAIQAIIGAKKPITMVQVFTVVGNVVYTGTGTALCRAGDRWQEEIGGQLAMGRALQSLGLALEHDALQASDRVSPNVVGTAVRAERP